MIQRFPGHVIANSNSLETSSLCIFLAHFGHFSFNYTFQEQLSHTVCSPIAWTRQRVDSWRPAGRQHGKKIGRVMILSDRASLHSGSTGTHHGAGDE